jgi:putative transcription factor
MVFGPLIHPLYGMQGKRRTLNRGRVICAPIDMLCELCGKETDRLFTVQIEGTILKVCKDCSKFGDQAKAGGKEPANKLAIENRLQNRERRMKTKDVYEQQEETIELIVDYPKRIKDTREALGWKQEELASKMGERLSIITKLERGDMRPDDALIHKVEKTLGIKITERVSVMKPEKAAVAKGGMTLSDFIKKE